MKAPLSSFGRSARGNAGIEFALIAPILLLLAGGVVEFGLAYHVYNQTNRLAAHYAIVWSDCPNLSACQAELATYTTPAVIGNLAPQLVRSKVTLQMFQVAMAGGTPSVAMAYPSGTSPSADQITALKKTVPDGQSGVIVTASYTHSLLFFPQTVAGFLSGTLLVPSYTVTQLQKPAS